MYATVPPALPDYVPGSPRPPGPLLVAPSRPVTLSVNVTNLGAPWNVSSTLAFYDASTPLLPFAQFPVPPLWTFGTAGPYVVDWISPPTLGTYAVVASVDYDNVVPELNETNNLYAWTINVVPGPITTLVVGQPNVTLAMPYVTSSTPLTLSVEDRSGLGIRNTTYRVDGGPWTNYTATGPFTLSGEGEHLVEWFSEDFAGNVESEESQMLRVDDAPPTTMATVGTPRHQGADLFVTSATSISLAAGDGGLTPVGLARTEYSVDGSPWSTYASAFTLPGNDGSWTVEYRSIDLLGNLEANQTLTLVLDNTPPASSASVGTPKYQGTDLYVTSATPVSVNATDEGVAPVGLASVEYRVDGGFWTPYAGNFTLAGEGRHTLEYRSTDLLGNAEAAQSLSLILDDTPPATTADVGTPRHVSDRTYVTSATPIALISVDGGTIPVGLASVEYRIDGRAWTVYAAAFTLSGTDGPRTIEYRSADLLGNTEAIRTIVVFLDDTPPTTDIAPGTGPFTTDTRFNLTATDAGCGVNRTMYRIDNGTWTTYTAPFAVPEGTHTIRFYSVDNLGNAEEENTIVVPVELPVAFNWKPFVALVFSIVLALAGAWSSKRAPWRGGKGGRATLQAFAIVAVPFIVLEAATGVVSFLTGLLAIPPVLGVGTAVDSGILALGLALALWRVARARNARPLQSDR